MEISVEAKNQFSLTRAALSTCGRAKSKFLSVLAYFLLVISAFGQAQTPPTVRDAYVLYGDPRVVSLRDELVVVVCKTEYDSWLKEQKDPKPQALSLYMNGLLMKGATAQAVPVVETDELLKSTKVAAACAEVSAKAVAAAQKDAGEKAAAAKVAAEAAKADTNKSAAAKEASDKAEAAAKDAATQQAGARQPCVIMRFYLDPHLVTDPNTKEPWLRLLTSGRYKDVSVSVGLADGSQWPSNMADPISFE